MSRNKIFLDWLLVVAFTFFLFSSQANNKILWANDQLNKTIQVYEDHNGDKSIQDIQQLPLSEFKPGSNHQNFGFTTSTWWIKFDLTNINNQAESLLLQLTNGHIHDIRFYKSPDAHFSAIITGNHYPFSSRPLKHTEYIFPITLDALESSTYYLRLEKKGAELNAPLQLLSGDYDYISQFNHWNLIFGSTFLYIAILFITVCIIRTRIILYYFIYAAFLCIYMATSKGITFSAFWPDQPWLQTNALELSKHLANIFYILFIMKFIGWNPINLKINFLLKCSILLCIGNIVCRLIYATTSWIPDSFMMRFVQTTALLLPLADVLLIYLLHQSWTTNKKTEVFWLLFLTIVIFIPLSFLVSLHFGWIPALPFYPNLLVILFLLEIICISVIIIYRYYELYSKEIFHLREITLLRKKAVENILLGQEEERVRIAKDLHDGIILSLAHVRMRLSSLEHQVESVQQKKLINELLVQLGNTSQEVRTISHNLAPLSLQHQELTKAIEELVYQIELVDSNMDIQFNYSPEINKSLSAILKQNIYQTVKELFNNILKYAKASEIKINLVQDQGHFQLDIEDNGQSYDPTQAMESASGLGLSSIQSRATLLNGWFRAIPKSGGGMLHRLSIPYSV